MLAVLRNGGHALVPGRPGRRPARDVRRVLRPAGLDPQGDRAAGDRAPGPGGRRLRPADRPGLPLRGRLRRRSSSPRSGPAPPTTPGCSPSATRRPSRRSSAAIPSSTSGCTGAGSISPKPAKKQPRGGPEDRASSASDDASAARMLTSRTSRSTGTILTVTSLSGNAAICLVLGEDVLGGALGVVGHGDGLPRRELLAERVGVLGDDRDLDARRFAGGGGPRR